MQRTLEVKTIEPAALSPKDAAEYLSLSLRRIWTLVADRVLKAKRSGNRTLIDFQSVKNYYASLPDKTVASIPNSPQVLRRAAPKVVKAKRR